MYLFLSELLQAQFLEYRLVKIFYMLALTTTKSFELILYSRFNFILRKRFLFLQTTPSTLLMSCKNGMTCVMQTVLMS